LIDPEELEGAKNYSTENEGGHVGPTSIVAEGAPREKKLNED